MSQRRILAVSLVGVLLTSFILAGLWGLMRISAISVYAKQVVSIEQEGTGLNLTMYGDPESSRQVLGLFEYFKTENLEWRGTFPPGPAPSPPIDISLNLSSVEFQQVNEDYYALAASYLEFHMGGPDFVDVLVKADDVDADLEYCACMDLPALNVTVVLAGNVEVSLSVSVLPLPGLMQAVYQYKGDTYIIHLCILKPLEVTITAPSEGDWVGDDVAVWASVKTAPGIRVDNVRYWADGEGHFEDQMWYNEVDGRWEGTWPTYYQGNGDCKLVVRAEGVQENVQGGMGFSAENAIGLQVDNGLIPVSAYVDNTPVNLQINWWHREDGGTETTPFEFQRWIDSGLAAPGEWDLGEGNMIHFDRWIIEENGNIVWQNGDTNLGLHQDMLRMLYGRQLKCIYKPG